MNYGDCQDELLLYRYLILMLTALAFCTTPAYPRNEYLNSYPNECRTGEVDVSVSQ
jgi:hypothetical protein